MSKILAGPGTLITRTPMGFCVGAAQSGGGNFGHPWQPSVAAAPGLTFSVGVVNGFVPTISVGGIAIPMNGNPSAGQAVPVLALDPSIAVNNQSWACLEVTPDPTTGALLTTSLIQIVHRNAALSTEPAVGRQPLALIVWANQRPGTIYAQTWFNLRYFRTTPAAGQGAPQHFFL